MNNNPKFLSYISKLVIALLFVSCTKELAQVEKPESLISNDAIELRQALQADGYSEIIVDSILKTDCYFEQWDKVVETAVSGLFEYYDLNDNWAASIDFGDGECDQWATKTWNVTMFPDYPSGVEEFSIFD